MKIMKSVAIFLAIGLVSAVSMGSAQAKCKSVNGHIISQVVQAFSNGDPCLSPFGLCAEGRYVGGIQGSFTFTVTNLMAPDADNVAFTTGVFNIDTKKYGMLTINDASAFSLDSDGLFGGVGTVVDGGSGRIRVYGVFESGCVDCDYRGEICTP